MFSLHKHKILLFFIFGSLLSLPKLFYQLDKTEIFYAKRQELAAFLQFAVFFHIL